MKFNQDQKSLLMIFLPVAFMFGLGIGFVNESLGAGLIGTAIPIAVLGCFVFDVRTT